MKLRREHLIVLSKMTSNLKGCLFLLFLCIAFSSNAQVYSITSSSVAGGVPSTSELNAPNVPTPGRFAITSTTANFGQVRVNYRVDGNAKSGQVGNNDFEELSGFVNFPASSNGPVFIDVKPLYDDLVEENETVTVTLTSVEAVGPGTASGSVNKTPATVTISDVSDVGIISLITTNGDFLPNAAEEGESIGRFRIELDKPNGTSAPVTVNYTLSGTADTKNGVDYAVTGAVAMKFNNNERALARNLVITPKDDAILEDAETVILTINSTDSPLFRIGMTKTATITIADNDCAAGVVAPVLNGNSSTFCDDFTIGLDTYYDGARPPGASLIWTTNNADPLKQADWAPRVGLSSVSKPGSYYAFFWDEANSCNSPTSEVVITQNITPIAGTLVSASPIQACNNESNEFGPNRINLNTLITDRDPNGVWTSSPPVGKLNEGAPSVNFIGRNPGTFTFTYTTRSAVPPCIDDSVVVTVELTNCDPCTAGSAAPVLDASVPTTFCGDITSTLNDYAPNAGPNGSTLRWASEQEDPTGSFASSGQVANPESGVYYGFYYDATNDCASPLLTLTLEGKPTPTITGTTPAERCGSGTLKLRAKASDNATLRWFSNPTGGAPLRSGAVFTTPEISRNTTYYVEATANDCASPRTAVVATVIPQPSAGVPRNVSSCNAADFGVTILNLDSTLSGTPSAGTWSLTSGPSAVSLNAENIADFQGSSTGDYVFTYTTTGAQAPCKNLTSVVTVSVSSCDTDDDNDGLLGGIESRLGTDPNVDDTDGDGVNDGVEVGDDPMNALDSDEDGVIDALDSNTLDTDGDGFFDQLDPANMNACIPDDTNGLCDTDEDGITDGQEEADGTNPLDACDPNIENENCDPTPIDIEVLKVVDVPNAVAGDEVVFTVTVNNLSNRTAIGITVGDMLEAGFDPNGNPVASIGSYDASVGEWTIPQLPAMGSATLNVPVSVLDAGPYSNIAELLESFPVDDNPVNDRAEVVLEIDLPEGIDLVLEKLGRIANQNDLSDITETNRSLSEVNPLVGQEIIFTLKISNESMEAAVSNIQVLDPITAVANSGFEFIEANADTGEYNETTGIWFIPQLERNQVAILEIRVSTPNIGTFQNTAEIIRASPMDSDGNYENNTSTVDVNVFERTEAEFGILFNQFSPNNDGVNDELKLSKRQTNEDGSLGEEVDLQYSIKIFNRYGSLVFEAENETDEVIWDGLRKGKEIPDGTYFYVLDLNLLEEIEGIERNSVKKGWIQIIR